MAYAELDNANPTILSVSELPSHRRRQQGASISSGKYSILELIDGRPSYATDPFIRNEFSDTEIENSTSEPIDEQEIYGEFPCPTFTSSFPETLEKTFLTHHRNASQAHLLSNSSTLIPLSI